MKMPEIKTARLLLRQQTKAGALAGVAALPPEHRAHVSPAWLAAAEASGEDDLWIHGCLVLLKQTGEMVGNFGFKGPPDLEGVVEIAYMIEPPHQRQGYATEAAMALTRFALAAEGVRRVRAHTAPEFNASARVLTRCGFEKLGEILHPEDGLVWRWERS